MAVPAPTMSDAARRMAAQEAGLGVLAERAVEVVSGRIADQAVVADKLRRVVTQSIGRRLSPQRRGLNEVLQAVADTLRQRGATQGEMAAILQAVPQTGPPGQLPLPSMPPDCNPLWRDLWLPGSGVAGVLASLTDPSKTGPVPNVTAVGPYPSLAAILQSLGPPPPGTTWIYAPADPNSSSTVPACAHTGWVGRVGYFNAMKSGVPPPQPPLPPVPPLPPILPPVQPPIVPPLPPPLPPGVCPPPIIVPPPCPPPVINLKCPDCNCPVPVTCPIELTIDQGGLATIWGQLSLSAWAQVVLDQAAVNNIFGSLGLPPPVIQTLTTVVVPISIFPGSTPTPTLLKPVQIQVPCGPGIPLPPGAGGGGDDMPLTLFSDGTWTRKMTLAEAAGLKLSSDFILSQATQDWPIEQKEEQAYQQSVSSAYVGSDV